MEPQTDRRAVVYRSYLLLLLANTIWGTDYPFYKILLSGYISPYALASVALIVAGIICAVSLLFFRGEKIHWKDLWVFAVAGLLTGVLRKGLLMVGISYASPIGASIITTVGPVIVLIISVMLMIEKLTRMKLIGLLLGLAGTLVIILFSGGTGGGHDRMLGNVIVFLATLTSAVYMVWLKKVVKKYQPLTVMRWMYIMAAIMALPFGIHYIPQTDFHAMTGSVFWLFLFVALLPTLLPNYIVISSTRFVNPTLVSVYGYVQPVVATVLSVAMGVDRLSWEQVVAGIVVFVGVYLVIRSYNGNSGLTPAHHMR